jgi:hypothetical protein
MSAIDTKLDRKASDRWSRLDSGDPRLGASTTDMARTNGDAVRAREEGRVQHDVSRDPQSSEMPQDSPRRRQWVCDSCSVRGLLGEIRRSTSPPRVPVTVSES